MPMSRNLARSTASSRAHRVRQMQYRSSSPVALPVVLRSRPLQSQSNSWTRGHFGHTNSSLHQNSDLQSASEHSTNTVNVNKTDFDNTLDLLKRLSEKLEREEKSKDALLEELEKERQYSRELEARLSQNRVAAVQAHELRNRHSGHTPTEVKQESHRLDALVSENLHLKAVLERYAETVRDLQLVTKEIRNEEIHESRDNSGMTELQVLKRIVRELALEVDVFRKADNAEDYAVLRRQYIDLQSKHQNTIKQFYKIKDELRTVRQTSALAVGDKSSSELAEVRIFESLYDALAEARTDVSSLVKAPTDSSDISGWFDSLCKDIEMRMVVNKTLKCQENFR